MKKIFTLILLISVSASMLAQKENQFRKTKITPQTVAKIKAASTKMKLDSIKGTKYSNFYYYDSEGRPIRLEFREDGLYNTSSITYNDKNQMIASLDSSQMVSAGGSTNLYIYKDNFEYNDAGLVSKQTEEHWDADASTWNLYTIGTYEYNAGNKLTSIINVSTDGTNKLLYYYTEDQLDSIISVSLSSEDSWVKTNEVEYRYFKNGSFSGRLSAKLESEYPLDPEVLYRDVYFYSYSYETNGDLKSESVSRFAQPIGDGSVTGEEVHISQRVFEYNAEYSYEDLLLPFMIMDSDVDFMFNHMLTKVTESFTDKQEKYTDDLHYSLSKVSGINEQTKDNDASAEMKGDELVISIATQEQELLQIFDLQGNIVKSKSVIDSQTVDLSLLPSGIYIYKLGTTIGKIRK